MRVETLIEALSQIDPKAEVRLHDPLGCEVLLVMSNAGDDSIVWLETEKECDNHSLICNRLNYKTEENALECYEWLMRIGYSVDMVHSYAGRDAAKEMSDFIDEQRKIAPTVLKRQPDDLLLTGMLKAKQPVQ